MTALQLISTIIFFAMPGSIGAIYYLCRLAVQRLPEYQALRIEQFARLAVCAVEQAYPHHQAKKALAQAQMAMLFEQFKLPVPSTQVMDIAIEAAVLHLPTTSGTDAP